MTTLKEPVLAQRGPSPSAGEIEAEMRTIVDARAAFPRQREELQARLVAAEKEAGVASATLVGQGLPGAVAETIANEQCGVTELKQALARAWKDDRERLSRQEELNGFSNVNAGREYDTCMTQAHKDRQALEDELLGVVGPLLEARLARATEIAARTEQGRALANQIGPARSAAHLASLGPYWKGPPTVRSLLRWLDDCLRRRGQT
jgi:hypothetical protein